MLQAGLQRGAERIQERDGEMLRAAVLACAVPALTRDHYPDANRLHAMSALERARKAH